MDFFPLVEKRRSVRKFTDRPIPEDKLTSLLEAANSAPSAGNLQSYNILVVKDAQIQQTLTKAAYDQQFLAEAPVNIVFIQDPDRAAKQYGERGKNFYSIQDATIAAAYLQLAAVELGMGSCWVGAFDEAKVKQCLSISNRPLAIVPVGYPQDRSKKTNRRDLDDLVSYME